MIEKKEGLTDIQKSFMPSGKEICEMNEENRNNWCKILLSSSPYYLKEVLNVRIYFSKLNKKKRTPEELKELERWRF